MPQPNMGNRLCHSPPPHARMPPLTDDPELTFLDTEPLSEGETDAGLLRHQLVTSPLLTYSVLKHGTADFPSRGLLGKSAGERVYVNTNTPSTTVICGVQGSGKSHTVACLLECALIQDSRIGQLPEPLSALVFHFDTQDGRPCEAAFLSSRSAHAASTLPQVTVLCSPSNINRRRRAYAPLTRVLVAPMSLSEQDLTADRMLSLMGCDDLEKMPLYMHIVLHIIRNMGVDGFNYLEFKRRISAERLDEKQRAMIKLRLDLLDAFVRPVGVPIKSYFSTGGLVLVDLTDPFLDSVTATVLFDIVLGTFSQWQTACGKLVVLDEAHKYLVNSDSARLTQSITDTIRLQRHLAIRVVIATQEPTVIPPTVLDLASAIICHRFSSPAWCAHLAKHLSAGTGGSASDWQEKVMLLATGDALVFAPAAVTRVNDESEDGSGVRLLGSEHLRLRVRPRLTLDGGASLLAVGRSVPITSVSNGSAAVWATNAANFVPASAVALQSNPTTAAAIPTATRFSASAAGQSIQAWVQDTIAATGAVSTAGLQLDSTIIPTPAPPPAHGNGSLHFPSGAAIPSSTPVFTSPTAGPSARDVSTRLKPLVEWLTRNGGVNQPLKFLEARTALGAVCEKNYVLLKRRKAWNQMVREAVAARIVDLPNYKVTKKELKARGEVKIIRLIDGGPFNYVDCITIPTPARPASSSASDTLTRRTVPAHLKHLVGWLTRNGGMETPLKLGDAHAALFWVGRSKKTPYPGIPQWWDLMIQEAVDAALVEVYGEEQTIRLLDGGPFAWF
ncbi:hypothetical protein C8R46DRAFT_1121634 [Mycena filopes]|nr:hypothetical protein C8R46DRAFT_1121634 [Mycena filopes]